MRNPTDGGPVVSLMVFEELSAWRRAAPLGLNSPVRLVCAAAGKAARRACTGFSGGNFLFRITITYTH